MTDEEGENEQVRHENCSGPEDGLTNALMAGPYDQKQEEDEWHKDMGTYTPSKSDIVGKKLSSQEAAILHDIKDKIGSNQVTASAIAFAPGWVI